MMKVKMLGKALFAWACLQASLGYGANVIQDIAVSKVGADIVVKVQMRDPVAEVPKGFSVSNPPRLAFDFPDTANGGLPALQNIRQGDLTSLNLVPAADRVRVVLNLVRTMNYETSVQGNAVIVTLKGLQGAQAAGSPRFDSAQAAGISAIRDITFRRGKDGEGRVVVDFAQSGAPVDVRQQGTTILVDFPRSSLPDHLRRKLDVTDFATPVVSILPQQMGEMVRLVVTPKGLWEHNAYQTDQQLILEVKPVIEDPNKLVQGSRLGYQGPLVSINYANGDVRALLRLMAEELGLDAVISETVTGSITLVLKDVPADQVMDIIFRQRGLDMRKSGKVILIAPREELSLRDKLDFESKQQISELEPLGMEVFQLSYQKAVTLAGLLSGRGGAGVAPGSTRMLSKRGSVTADNMTNTLFVNDIPSKLEEIRRFVKTIDVGSRQVLIEARVVEANDSFNKDLGVRMNLLNTRYNNRIGSLGIAGGTYGTPSGTLAPDGTGSNPATQTSNRVAGVNLPSFTSTGATFGLSLFNSSLTRILNLELAALESDGRGKLVSSPKVVTANNVEATIEDGTEIPYIIPAAGNNNATVSFKKAKLSLKATPQITPEGKVRMKLNVAKEEPDWTRQVAGIPPIKSSIVDTDVVVDNGGTVVIGGVFTVASETATERVPFLGDLPYIGFLFKVQNTNSARRELLIFITPRVINEQMDLR